MTGQEHLSVGDQLICISNEGLKSVGTKLTITGLQDEFISFSRGATLWEKRSELRWDCYKHEPMEGR